MQPENLHKCSMIICGKVHGEFVLDFSQPLCRLHVPLAALSGSFSENCQDFLAGEGWKREFRIWKSSFDTNKKPTYP